MFQLYDTYFHAPVPIDMFRIITIGFFDVPMTAI